MFQSFNIAFISIYLVFLTSSAKFCFFFLIFFLPYWNIFLSKRLLDPQVIIIHCQTIGFRCVLRSDFILSRVPGTYSKVSLQIKPWPSWGNDYDTQFCTATRACYSYFKCRVLYLPHLSISHTVMPLGSLGSIPFYYACIGNCNSVVRSYFLNLFGLAN